MGEADPPSRRQVSTHALGAFEPYRKSVPLPGGEESDGWWDGVPVEH